MNILLTNDDGYGADGIMVQAEILRKDNEVWILAPSANRSGASSSIVMNSCQRIEKKGRNEYALDGTPADCILCAMKSNLFPSKPDIVFSGINKYGNLGTDIIYSGTCAAARQAVLDGIPGIALSVEPMRIDGKEYFDYESLSHFAALNIKSLLECCPSGCFINVNAPSVKSYVGVKFASLSKRFYNDKVNIISKNDENLYSTCTGGIEVPFTGDSNNDSLLVKEGYVTISAVYADSVADLSLCNKSTSQFVL